MNMRKHRQQLTALPLWVVLHIPHDSTHIPAELRDQFLPGDESLLHELHLMTDHHKHDLFAQGGGLSQVVRVGVSRLVVDVERFAADSDEPMAARGMGAVYALTLGLQRLRCILSTQEREHLMQLYYNPHHQALQAAVNSAVKAHGRCLVVDCHSFPSQALPYEDRSDAMHRPDICIGTDDFHTSDALDRAFVNVLRQRGGG